MRTITSLIFTAAFYFSAVCSTLALDFPFHEQEVTQHNKHQRSTTDVTIQEDGTVSVVSRFENANRVDGDHYTAVVLIRGTDNQPLAVIKQVKGVNPRGFGRTQVATDTTRGQIPRERLSEIKDVSIDQGFWDSRNDEAIWSAVAQIAKAFMDTQQSGFLMLK